MVELVNHLWDDALKVIKVINAHASVLLRVTAPVVNLRKCSESGACVYIVD